MYVWNEWAKFVSLMSDVCIQVVRELNESELPLLGLIQTWREVHLKGLSIWICDQAIQGKTSVFLV